MTELNPGTPSPDKNIPVLSIIILSWNTRDILNDCLTSIFEFTSDINFEVIVVDNASSDGSVDMIKTQFPQVRIIVNETNVGTARAVNAGLRASKGCLMLLIGSDTFVRDDVITKMTKYILSRPKISMAGCQMRYPDGRLQYSANRSLSIWRSLFEDFWIYKFVPSSVRDNILLGGYWDHSTEKEVDWITGAFMMLRRDVFEEVGGISEDIFMHGDDNEWCMRIKKAGKRIFYNPLGTVYHIGGSSSVKKWNEKEWIQLCHLGGLWVYSKTNGRLQGIFFHLAKLLGTMARFIAYSILVLFTSNDYYSYQRRLYGWQAEIYLRALKPGVVSHSLSPGVMSQKQSN